MKRTTAHKWIIVTAAMAALSLPMATNSVAGECFRKAAEGTGGDTKSAKFQVYEALLQATDWGAWAAWMTTGKTPGYKVGPVKYRCKQGTGLGVTCRGQAKICKL